MVKIELKVVMLDKSYNGKMIVGMNRRTMEGLDIKPGDVLKLSKGNQQIYGLAWPTGKLEPDQVGLDGLFRKNLNVSQGDVVELEPVTLNPLTKVTVSIMTEHDIHNYENELKRLILEYYVDKPVSVDNVYILPLYEPTPFRVIRTAPDRAGLIKENTVIEITTSKELQGIPRVTYDDIGGLDDVIQKIRETVELPIKYPELFQRLGITPPKGVLLYGPPGTGKTLLAQAVANETNANFYHIAGPEIVSKFVGESEERLRKIFERAKKTAPSIIFIDEIDAIAPKRAEVSGEVEKRLVAQLLTLMDGLERRGEVIVIAATNRPEEIDEALRRPGRFDREIEINPPDRNGRVEILKIHTRNMPLQNVDLEKIADITHGYTGADLSALAKEAALAALRRYLRDESFKKMLEQNKLDQSLINKIVVTEEDFYTAMNQIQPSALREIYVQKPNVRWEQIGGLKKVKEELKEIIEYSLNHPEIMERYGILPVKGVLLYGPPGTGKTLLAKAAATAASANFIAINGPEVFSKWVGESEKNIREIFKKARQTAPCIIFIDEIDAIASVRSGDESNRVEQKVVNALLTEMDGIKNNRKILVIGATNRIDIIDPALLRPGRFDKKIEIGAPNREERSEIFRIHTSKMPLGQDVNIEELADITDGYTGADIADVAREAALSALREKSNTVNRSHFIHAIENRKQQRSSLRGYI
ncbi:MAG: CDC48 family AAA ATPase [Candidatus Micrarchaeota archaeon]|nr:CDC48 family AAA ATPase [Candidatus Micrarchaeota archaeon]MCX8154508.1 CDC48 family AAA ATPase [Candidatus Micrarchaeota archaeon]